MHDLHFFGGVWMMLLWLILIITIIVVMIRFSMKVRTTDSEKQAESLLEILKRRYAEGEITKQEYAERKKDLKD